MSGRECGPDPMRPADEGADTALVIATASRYSPQAALPPPSKHRAGGDRDTQAGPSGAPALPAPTETMDELRKMEVATLRERVTRSEYEVDARAVAGAILARLLAERPAGDPGK